MNRLPVWIYLFILVLLLSACSTEYPESCPSNMPVGLVNADEIAGDESLPLRFPLKGSPIDKNRYYGWFGVSNECFSDAVDCYEFPEVKYHAAEDYKRPPGTPVYAMADGKISFSGTAGGYGWLILVNHPQFNLYSLYGHLSPSRWRLPNRTEVKRGDLIGYLGDSDENGGSKDNPLDPHLHFGIRAGQVADYPSGGEWRYMAGWIKLCPQDLGWLQPSAVISGQATTPPGNYPQPKVDFLIRWGVEALLSSLYLAGGVVMLVRSPQRNLRFLLLLEGAVAFAAGFIFQKKGMLTGYILSGLGVVLICVSIYQFIRHARQKQPEQPI